MAVSHTGPEILHERREQRLTLLLLAPALAIVICLLVLPLLWLAWQSIRADGGFTLVNYQRFLTDDIYLISFLQTFRIAIIVTVVTLLLGYPVAYAASMAPRHWSVLILAAVVLPFWTSVLVRAYAWLILLQRRGLVNSALMDMGLIDSPLLLVNNEFGTVLATIHILLPFMVLPLYATMQKIPRELTMAGSSLGGSPVFVFTRVFLPLSMPGVIAGMVLVFVLTLGFYITPELLGGGRTFMVSMLVSRNIEIYHEWGAASSISVVLLLSVFLIFRLSTKLVPFERIMGTR
ncbi:ABC transporter permease [Pseudochelatococcus contaminans]|uniref:Putative spermidine/putrescine transport system permease protein n=1 Tax=Pseudochelatococcus contaminans TaxID=1538103 RepID=A0A7W5Z5H0_9HYPH|nr:ABC transporter permease [Pseudochelatococcus contaminans]MBB3810548.1 putative spermidine/putrescine transport system permease protein [Pseudochelatococcus contaminans]